MNLPIVFEKDQKKTKRCAWIATIIYLLLLPFLFMMAVASIMVFDCPDMAVPIGLSIIFMYFCVPLSIPFTLYLIWSRYSRNDYKKSRQFCLIPLGLSIATIAYDALVDVILVLF